MSSKKNKVVFVSPYEVNYKIFLDAIPNKVSVKEYCKGHLTDEQIDFVIEDLKHFKNNK